MSKVKPSERVRAREIQRGWDAEGHATARATLGLPELPKGLMSEDPQDYTELAKHLVHKRIIESGEADEDDSFEIFVVWFAYTLRSWKAIVATSLPDNQMYEIIHSADRNETYIDTYVKIDNYVVPNNTPTSIQGDNA